MHTNHIIYLLGCTTTQILSIQIPTIQIRTIKIPTIQIWTTQIPTTQFWTIQIRQLNFLNKTIKFYIYVAINNSKQIINLIKCCFLNLRY